MHTKGCTKGHTHTHTQTLTFMLDFPPASLIDVIRTRGWGHCRCVIDFKRLSGTGVHSAAPRCEYFRAFLAWRAGLGHILLRPWEVESNIHYTQLGKKRGIKNTTGCHQKSPRHRQGWDECVCVVFREED